MATMAYMSDAGARCQTWLVPNSEAAVYEAERILEETERGTKQRSVGNVRVNRFENPLSLIAQAGDDLAADLAAILPVLDELAVDAVVGTIRNTWDDLPLGTAIYCRNRATLAAMDRR